MRPLHNRYTPAIDIQREALYLTVTSYTGENTMQNAPPNNGFIYGILDTLAGELLGPYLTVLRADAAAIRMFGDSCNADRGPIAQHPEDYELVRLGILTLTNTINSHNELQTVITGKQWLAAQNNHKEDNQPQLSLTPTS